MSDIDIESRMKELHYYQQKSKELITKFNDLVQRHKTVTSQESTKILTPAISSTHTEMICTECLSNGCSTKICDVCLSKSNDDNYSPIWLLPRTEKLQIYENAINESGRLTEPEMVIPFSDGLASTSSNDNNKTFAEITKYKRDIKRKRMKHRTTKAPPLTHTEELRGLISLQMELWEDFVRPKTVKR